MDKTINVSVQNKIAMADGTVYICGNSDYLVEFDFDREWEEYEYKTARFLYAGTFQDILFQGTECPVPVLSNITNFKIGVFAGDLSTTTAAIVYAKKSVLCSNGSPAAPTQDVYNQILSMLNEMEGATEEEIEAAVAEYMRENPTGVITPAEIDNILNGA